MILLTETDYGMNGAYLFCMKTAAPKMIGSMNATTLSTVFKGKKVVGTCMHAPNACAYAMAVLGADRCFSKLLGTYKATDRDMASRIPHKGWMSSDEDAALVRY